MPYTFAAMFFLVLCGCLIMKSKMRVINEKAQELCNEFEPRFQSKGYKIEYFRTKMVVVFSHLETAAARV